MLDGFVKGFLGVVCGACGGILLLVALFTQSGLAFFFAVVLMIAGAYLKYVSRQTVRVRER